MDEEVMDFWIRNVLEPYLATAPPGIHPVILLDSYRCHMMGSVLHRIEALGCQVEHIPPCCTPLCQLIDIGVCKPLKDCMKLKCDSFLFEQYKQGVEEFRAPTRGELAGWIHQPLTDVSTQTIINS